MGFAGIALSKGFFCFSYAMFKMDVCVVCGVPLSNQWGSMRMRFGHTGLIYDRASKYTIASKGKALYASDGERV